MPFEPFHHSCQDITIDQSGTLHCRAMKHDGCLQDASLDLTRYIGNTNGYLVWKGRHFSRSAERLRFDQEDPYNRAVLSATLTTEGGDKRDSEINLAENIGNNNGQLYFRGWNR
ncbi:hypothetical protein ASPZODRAFT_11546 [Penicilliopsis zonata CBS 506.65]|uniref:Cyanovirin-N domain-containing protein n=1 Tax=Penicilliopsis zonata CBS 506.65 TaxID=1073090 RepID=A0A1L9SU10_9EURO|nr:hypothetical protein ASPZODRAFT_11546 [Penicilliopsis zonata CBS 506.65]OJJ50688.1 hypothetical protein ASPZODRAFT_11546 [Penicilliopsis zonata CBS 506.65]